LTRFTLRPFFQPFDARYFRRTRFKSQGNDAGKRASCPFIVFYLNQAGRSFFCFCATAETNSPYFFEEDTFTA
jgi:hypothetical protein